jgi:hypothetical protein
MIDPMNASQQTPAVKEDQWPIPTRADQKKRSLRIWAACICFSLFVLVSMGGTILVLIVKNQDIQRIVAFSTVTFQVIIGMFATGFTTPLFLEQRLNFILSVEMGRRGLEATAKMSDVLDKIDTSIDARLKRLDNLLDGGEQLKDGKGPLIEVFRQEMTELRKEIRASKTETETELSAALDEGERAAAEIEQGGKQPPS